MGTTTLVSHFWLSPFYYMTTELGLPVLTLGSYSRPLSVDHPARLSLTPRTLTCPEVGFMGVHQKIKDDFLLGLSGAGPLCLISPDTGKLLKSSNEDFSVSTSPLVSCASDSPCIKWDNNRAYIIWL